MGWLGTLWVGAVVGWASWCLENGWRRIGRGWWMALVAAVAALMIKMLGNITGLFLDGSTLEWLGSVLAAIVAAWLLSLWRPQWRR